MRGEHKRWAQLKRIGWRARGGPATEEQRTWGRSFRRARGTSRGSSKVNQKRGGLDKRGQIRLTLVASALLAKMLEREMWTRLVEDRLPRDLIEDFRSISKGWEGGAW